MREPSRRLSLGDIPPEHRAFVEGAAKEENVTVEVWFERIIEREKVRRGEARGGESGFETLGGGAAEEVRRRAAAHRASRSLGEAGEGAHGERETEIEETVETERLGETRAEAARHAGPLHRRRSEGERFESGLSDYHRGVAAREAAAEGVPVPIWLEQVIHERSRRVEREPERARVAHGPAASPMLTETVVRGRGGDLAPLILGAILAILLILLLSWFRWGPSMFFGHGRGGDGGGCCLGPSPATPANGSSAAGPGVIVTTLVDGAAHAASPHVASPVTPTPRPAAPPWGRPARHHWRHHWGDAGRSDAHDDWGGGWGGRYGLDCGCDERGFRREGYGWDESTSRESARSSD